MELALATIEKKVVKPDLVFYQPVGAVLLVRSAEQVRRKWAEIICVLCSPVRRTTRGPTYAERHANFPHTGLLLVLWKPEWFEAYWLHERRFKDMPLDDLWRLITEDGRVLEALPKDPLGTHHITEAWPWSDAERKELVLVVMDEAPMSPVEKQTIDAKGEYQVAGVTWSGPLSRVDWKTDLALPAKDISAILDPKVVWHPRLNVKLPKSLIKMTTGPVAIGGV